MDKATLSLYQLENGYCYNSDSLFLYAFIARFLKNGVSVVDIGAGCGILGLLCGRDFSVDLSLIDIDETNAKLCKKNADFNNINAEIFCGKCGELHKAPPMRWPALRIFQDVPKGLQNDPRSAANLYRCKIPPRGPLNPGRFSGMM